MPAIKFEGSLGHKLTARLDEPDPKLFDEPRAYALYAHCFTCSKDIFAASYIAKALTALGISVFRFDFTGLGQSEGEFEDTNFTSNVQDLLKASEYMKTNAKAPDILIGHSLGGAAVLVAAHEIAEAKAVVTIGAPSDTQHVTHNFEDCVEYIREHGEATVCLAGREFVIQDHFLQDLEKYDMDEKISELKKPLLVMHAPLDETVGIENAKHIFVTAKHPKSYVSLDDADHLLTNREDAKYAAHMIAAWASHYVGYETILETIECG